MTGVFSDHVPPEILASLEQGVRDGVVTRAAVDSLIVVLPKAFQAVRRVCAPWPAAVATLEEAGLVGIYIAACADHGEAAAEALLAAVCAVEAFGAATNRPGGVSALDWVERTLVDLSRHLIGSLSL